MTMVTSVEGGRNMENATMWLARERILDARQRADKERLARTARRGEVHRSLLERIRGDR